VTLFTQMSRAVHGLVSQPVFRLGSGAFETVVAVLLLIPMTARLGADDCCVDDCRNSQSHFRVGIWLVLVDALMVMVLAVSYLLLARWHSIEANPKAWRTTAALQNAQK